MCIDRKRKAATSTIRRYRCGLRLGELIGLRWVDVDLDRRELRAIGQLQDGRRKKGKTKKAHRAAPLSAVVVAILRWHWQNQNEERAIAGDSWNKAGLVFCSKNGTPLILTFGHKMGSELNFEDGCFHQCHCAILL